MDTFALDIPLCTVRQLRLLGQLKDRLLPVGCVEAIISLTVSCA